MSAPSRPAPEQGVPAGPGGPAWLTTVRFMRTRKTLIPRLHERFGDTFSLEILPRGSTIVVFSDPADVKEIFAGDPTQLHAGEGNAILGPVMGKHSVLLTDDLEHQRGRTLLMPAFTGGAMRAYAPLVAAVAKAEVDGWADTDRLPTLDRMNAVTLEIILQVVFGVSDEERLAELRPRMNRLVDVDTWLLFAWLYPRLRSLPPWRGYFANLAEVDALLFAEIAERRQATDLADRDDVLSRLLLAGGGESDEAPLTDQELRDQLVTLLLAGHETTASALSWTLHELGRDPERHARATRAADEGDDAYLEACLKEAMRLHPIIDFVARTLKSEQVIGGRTLPRGVTVTPSIMLAHRREEAFPDAGAFRPERFLDERPAPNTWIPFGGGARRCIGAAFSLMEGTVVLREVLQRHTVHAARPAPTRLRNITNVPADKAPLSLAVR